MSKYPKTALITISMLLISTASFTAKAEEPWHDHSLKFFMGAVTDPATIAARDTYSELKMGSETASGVAFTTVMSESFDIEFAVLRLQASGIQRNFAGSGNENNYMTVNLTFTDAYITGILRGNTRNGLFVPWLGAGINASMIESTEEESLLAIGGYLGGNSLQRTSSAFGLHAGAGIDIYPAETSAFALTLEVRGRMTSPQGPLDATYDSYAILAGIKWDFWPKTR